MLPPRMSMYVDIHESARRLPCSYANRMGTELPFKGHDLVAQGEHLRVLVAVAHR